MYIYICCKISVCVFACVQTYVCAYMNVIVRSVRAHATFSLLYN